MSLRFKIEIICRELGEHRYLLSVYKSENYTLLYYEYFPSGEILVDNMVIYSKDGWISEISKPCREKLESEIYCLWEQALESRNARIKNEQISKHKLNTEAVKKLCKNLNK
jgi:hypothetical protein